MGSNQSNKVVSTVCSSHCGGACLLKVHVSNGTITRIETDDGNEPQLRGCLKGRAYRQRIYDPNRLLYPLKRVGARGGGKFERITWNEALDTVAGELIRIRDAYGPASIMLAQMPGDHCASSIGTMERLLNLAGGCTTYWGVTSFQAGMVASLATYGMWHTDNGRADLVNSKLIIMWGWNPADTIHGTNTSWYLSQAKEAGAKVVCVDPTHTDSVATFADQWVPIRPGTDTAMLIAMAHVMISERLQDENFLKKFTVGFEKFRDYVLGVEDMLPKNPSWAAEITGVPAEIIEDLARQYATIKPAALIAGIAPGRSSHGEQYHRAASTLAAMTGNIGIHGGDAAGRAWGSLGVGGFPYPEPLMPGLESFPNPLEDRGFSRGWGPVYDVALGLKPRIHFSKFADAILKGKAGGYHTDYKALYVSNCSYLTQLPNANKVRKALQSLEFIAVQEQLMTPTAKYADIILPVNTFMERNEITAGHGAAFVGSQNQVIEPLGESKSMLQIGIELAKRMGIVGFLEQTEEKFLQEKALKFGVTDYSKLKEEAVYWYPMPEPYVAFQQQIEDPANNPFYTPSGKIEIDSRQWAAEANADLPPIPQWIEPREGLNSPLAKKYPLQVITTHFKRRVLSQFNTIPWLTELQPHAILINTVDAQARDITDGEMVTVYNDRGEMVILARVTERIMPGVVNIPHGAWYEPDANGLDRGGCANVLTSDEISPFGAFLYNEALVQVERLDDIRELPAS